MTTRTAALAAAIALVATPLLAQTVTTIPLKGADSATYQEGGVNDVGGRFYPGHVLFGWTGTALRAATVDGPTGDLRIICDSGCSGGGAGVAGGAVAQSGAWNVGLTGLLPAFASPPTFNLGALNGAATAAGQATENGYLQTLAGTVSGSSLQVAGAFFQPTQPISAAALPLPTGAATVSAQATTNSSLSVLVTNTTGLALHSDALAILAALGTPLQAGGAVTVSNLQATQPVSAAALPLPAGAATAARQDALLAALGTPLQAGGAVTVSGGPTATAQATANGSLASIAANTVRSGSGGFVAVSTAPPANGVALPVGVIGTRIYVDASADSVTYAIEPASQCGSSAPAVTRTMTGPGGGADENLTGGLVVCVTAATGAPRARAY